MFVSVTIPVFNDNEGLRKSLQSLIIQSYQNWEAVVVDDGSPVSAEGVVNEFNDKRIIFHRFQSNQGRPAARQKTFELMSGDLCAFLDAGDVYTKDFLNNAVVGFENNDIVAFSQSMLIKYKNTYYQHFYKEGIYDIRSEFFSDLAFACTVFRAECCRGYKFNLGLKYSQDKHFLNHVAAYEKGSFQLLNSGAYIYDQGNNMKLITTVRKYYYAIKRLLNEKKFQKMIMTFFKGLGLSSLHFICGYSKLLEVRYSKIKNVK